LRFIGDRIFEPYNVLADENLVEGLASAIADTGLPIDLKRLPADAAIVRALKAAYRGRGFIHIVGLQNGCPYIDLDDSWSEPERHFNASWRSSFRRMWRRAEGAGEVRFEVAAPARAEVRALIEEAFAVEAAGWKGARGSAMAVSRWRSNFYRRFAELAAEEGILRLCFLRIDGQAAAMEYAVECNERFFVLKIGYDETFDSFSPGNLLRLETVRYAARRGLYSYEFLGTDAPWTYFWTTKIRPMVSLQAYPATKRGLLALAVDKLRLAPARKGRR
jgi:CelD/BcsL family acetyltransferase involved in cellulose biosynthesis